MDDRRVRVIYQEYVVAHDLERIALLEALRERCARDATVLYPGSSVHVTPSFFFPHVVYVDRSELSRDFFARERAVLELVNARKTYRRLPFLRYVQRDFTTDLPLRVGSFDVLLALYCGGVSRACARYLKVGGLLVTNDHQGDARDAAGLAGFELCAVIEERHGKVRFEDQDLARDVPLGGPPKPRRRGEAKPDHYLFRKVQER